MATATGNQPAALRRPLVELLTTSNCRHRDAALALVQRVCGQLDGQAEIRVVEVADQPAAERLRFLGSPTIRVNGRDIEPGAEQNREYVRLSALSGSAQPARAARGDLVAPGPVRPQADL